MRNEIRIFSQFRFPFFLFILFSGLISSPAAAHGADTHWVIIRQTRTDPDNISSFLNDSVEFHSTVDENLTIQIDVDGDGTTNGSSDYFCFIEISDKCTIWLNPINWSSGSHLVEIINVTGIVRQMNISIQIDNHPSEENPEGYSFVGDRGGDEAQMNNSSISWLVIISLMWVGCLGMVARNM